MGENWITLDALGTFSGAVFTVTIIVQVFKELLDRLVKVPTRIAVVAISWVVLLGHRFVTTGGIGMEGLYLDLLNGFLVTLASMGAYCVARDKLQWK